jgi:HD-like signal output (HDOD) protein
VEELEQVMMGDPAVVHKLIQVVNSASLSGALHRDSWSLQEAIVRLGRKKVGAIALQIKLMNSLVRPQESKFDLGSFWRHSVACALIADKLVAGQCVSLPEPVSFDQYWIASLLHDIGKLVLGFFFWNHFEDVLGKMNEEKIPFREAERALGDFANHEFLGRLLLLRSKVDGDLAETVGSHHALEDSSRPLVWLVHLADNLSKEMDLAYLPGAPPNYSASVLKSLNLDRQTAAKLAQSLGEQVTAEVEELVEQCFQG